MSHTKMEFETVNCYTEKDFKNKIELLSYLGWLPLSTNCNNTILVDEEIDKWQAILTRPIDYVESRTIELESNIERISGYIASDEYWIHELGSPTPKPMTEEKEKEFKQSIAKYKTELEILQKEK